MFSRNELRSPRLSLIPATPGIIEAELDGHAALAAELRLTVPSSWPPQYYDEAAQRWTLAQLANPGNTGWLAYYLAAGNELVGLVGYKGPPDAAGVVEVGYGLVPEQQGKGYASEATGALVDHALSFPGVRAIIAETLPALGASIRVLERTGFRPIGEGSERGVIRFELTREDVDAGRRTIPEHLRTLVRLLGHLAWADRRALAAVAVEPTDDTALKLLGHILGAEHVWLARLNGTDPQVAVWPTVTLAQCRQLAAANELAFRSFLFPLSPAGLRRNISYHTSAGDEFVSTVEDILLHCFLHGTYHRGQIAQQQRLAGQTPGASDYIAFARGAPAATRPPGDPR